MVPIPVSNLIDSSFGVCFSPNIRLGTEDSESQEPQILLQNPSTTFCKTANKLFSFALKPLNNGIIWKLVSQKKITQCSHMGIVFTLRTGKLHPASPQEIGILSLLRGGSRQSRVNFLMSICSLLSPSLSSNCLVLKIQFLSTWLPDRQQRGKRQVKIRARSTSRTFIQCVLLYEPGK